MSDTIVSVCVATYDYGRFLPDCIESVLAQSLDAWELIVVDDCSTDGTQEIVNAYASDDPRIRYFRNPERIGMYANISRAASLGRGRYLKILCADDWIAPRCLEMMYNLMEAYPTVSLGTCAEIHTDADGAPRQVQFLFGAPVSVISGKQMLDRMGRGHGFGGNSSFFIRTSSYHEIGGYNKGSPYAGDYELAARLCRVGDYLHTDVPLFYGRSHPNSSSRTDPLRLVDVPDWFAIPDQVFRPRRFPGREWRRHFILSANLTARYSVNAVLQSLRGERAYAKGLTRILRERGNFVGGVPFLAVHVPVRVYRRLNRSSRPRSLPAEDWMGPPPRGASR